MAPSKKLYTEQGTGKTVKGADGGKYLLCCITRNDKQVGCAITFLDGLYMIPIENLVSQCFAADVTEGEASKQNFAEGVQSQIDPKNVNFGPAEVRRSQGCRLSFPRKVHIMNKAEFLHELENNPTVRNTRYIKCMLAPKENSTVGEREKVYVFA